MSGRCSHGPVGPVPDQEAGIAGELVLALGNDLNDELLGDNFSPGGQALIQYIGFVQFSHDAAGIRGVRRLQCLQRTVLGFLDVGTEFVIVGCRLDVSHF